jgi:hypothetical protein
MIDHLRPCKTCEESPLYEKNKKIITDNIKLLDDFLSGPIFAISLKPEEFPVLNTQTRVQSIKIDEALGLPAVIIYFKEFDEKIILLDIEVDTNIPF